MKFESILFRARWISFALGSLWIGGCTTDAQLRDFLSSTAVRTFWQTLGTAIQAAIVNANQGA
ncbi:MAG: hypothetical protein U1D55_00655 [Phycisphaerae bacterium]